MTDALTEPAITRELGAINAELSAIMRVRPASLVLGADSALDDELVICGILGGKDVGKSTLINALARVEVSIDRREVGKGTERPMVYVHEEMQETVTHRLSDIARHGPLDVTPHGADAVRNVVLVDLPDFDSEFEDHFSVVLAVAPLLDRVLWIQTPRKLGDRAWVEMFREVIKDARNVHCVLNKVDELLADSDPFEARYGSQGDGGGRRADAFWKQNHAWVRQTMAAAGCPCSDDHRFLVAAAFPDPDRFVDRIAARWDDSTWSRYEGDRRAVTAIARLASDELDRLRSRVLSPVSHDDAIEIKTANRARELRVNAARMREHYDLDRLVAQLAQACDADYHQQVLSDAMDPGYCGAVAAALRTRLRSDAELADELLERRVERWPLLRVVHWPLGWLSRIVGRRVSPGSRTSVREVADPFQINGRSLADRIGLLRSRILGDHSVVASQLGLDGEIPAANNLGRRVTAAANRIVPRVEAQLIDELDHHDRRASILGRALLWLVLFWFPFLQPILEGALEMYVQTGGWDLAHGMYRIVSAFSAPHLLAGLAVVAGVYVALLAVMYAHGLRAIRQLRGEQAETDLFAHAVDDAFVCEVVSPLARPFRDRLDRLTALLGRLDGHNAP